MEEHDGVRYRDWETKLDEACSRLGNCSRCILKDDSCSDDEKTDDMYKKYVDNGCTLENKESEKTIRLLPESWLQKRTITLDYATLRNQYFQRRNHKLTEWHTYCKWIESLPYAKDLICLE